MSFDENLYNFDRDNAYHEATLKEGAYLYRLTSINHASFDDILSGRGPEKSRAKGRFNAPMQRTSYCTNNVLVCMAEVLYHMYRTVLHKITLRKPYRDILSSLKAERCLTIVRVSEIGDLVYTDCEGVVRDMNARFSGTAVVYPDDEYQPFLDFNDFVRSDYKKGVIYPSARHSKDICIALFDDETGRIKPGTDTRLNVQLQLVSEEQDPLLPPEPCDPYKKKLHATMGYYSFVVEDEFKDARDAGLLNPVDIPTRGMVDFVRRRYQDYPRDAVR